jgi:hypothetical protein
MWRTSFDAVIDVAGVARRGALRKVALFTVVTFLVAVSLAGAGAGKSFAATNGWHSSSVPAPKGGGVLWSISCVSGGSWCMAVGFRSSGLSLAEELQSGKWRVVAIPGPDRYTPESVSCTSATFCAAVGTYGLGVGTVAVALTWNGTSWSADSFPGIAGSSLLGVKCVNRNFCVAVGGESVDIADKHDLALLWNGSSWSRMKTPYEKTNSNWYSLGSVSCSSVRYCVAMGDFFADVFSGGKWTSKLLPHVGGNVNTYPRSVVCWSAGNCEAIGGSPFSTGGLAWAERSGKWTVRRIGSMKAAFQGLSCASSKSCIGVGYTWSGSSSKPGFEQATTESWNGSSWTSVSPGLARQTELDGISASTSRTWVIGNRYTGTVNNATLYPIALWK